MKHFFLLNVMVLIPCITNMNAQTVQRIADINPGTGSSLYEDYNVLIEYQGKLLFTANDGVHGIELWIYDGISASLLKDIYPGPKSSNAQNYFIINDQVMFTARDSLYGFEWWTTDGTADGTQLVKDIYPGAPDGVFSSGNDRLNFHIYNDHIYFAGIHRPNDYELWKTNGTEAGTLLVKNIATDGFSINFSSFPSDYAEHDGTLFFSTREGLWKTNGTTSGTVLVEDEDPEDVFGLEPRDLISNGDYLLFIQDDKLWRSDGTSNGTMKVKNVGYVNLNWFGLRFTRLGNIVLFPGSDGTHGEELWRSDGTPDGTHLVVDLDPGTDGYAPQNNIFFQNKMYYKGDDGERGIELWSSDGTEAGTQLVKELDPGFSSGFYLPTTIYTDGELIYMSAGPAFQKELWISDGTTSGTYEVDINPEGESRPTTFYKYGDHLVLFAETEGYGWEPFLVTLTTSNEEGSETSPIKIYPNPTNSLLHIEYPDNINLSHTLFDIKGNVILNGIRKQQIDLSGLPIGTYVLKTINEGSGMSYFEKVVLVK